jgi:transcriptional regulator with XRE-family HTH domain
MTFDAEVIGENIKRIRLLKNMSQNELAKKSSVAQSGISLYEEGTRKPKIETIKKLSKALGVTLEQLIDYKFSKMTNADRIRSMSDEELEEWLTSITNDAQRAIVESQCFVDYQWKEWLKSEVDND